MYCKFFGSLKKGLLCDFCLVVCPLRLTKLSLLVGAFPDNARTSHETVQLCSSVKSKMLNEKWKWTLLANWNVFYYQNYKTRVSESSLDVVQ